MSIFRLQTAYHALQFYMDEEKKKYLEEDKEFNDVLDKTKQNAAIRGVLIDSFMKTCDPVDLSIGFEKNAIGSYYGEVVADDALLQMVRVDEQDHDVHASYSFLDPDDATNCIVCVQVEHSDVVPLQRGVSLTFPNNDRKTFQGRMVMFRRRILLNLEGDRVVVDMCLQQPDIEMITKDVEFVSGKAAQRRVEAEWSARVERFKREEHDTVIVVNQSKKKEKATARTCARCHKADSTDLRLNKSCARCKSVDYCGKECQRHDWGLHKSSCRASP